MPAVKVQSGFEVILDLAGAGLNGGSVYIGIAGQDPQTFPQQVWWDAAQTIPAAQPLATIGGYIARLGSPAIAYVAADYSMRVRDRAGVQLSYATTLTPDGLFVANGVGAVSRTVPAKLREMMSVADFGAVGDGGTDDTAAIQAAIKAAGQAFAGTQWWNAFNPNAISPQVVQFTSGKTYRIAGTVYVPQGVIVDFNNATIIGTGFALTDNVLFETGYFLAGNLISNWAAGDEAQRVVYTAFLNGRFRNARTAFRLFNFNEGSRVENCSFDNVRQPVVASRAFYGSFRRLMSRGTSGGATEAAFEFYNSGGVTVVNNIIELDSVVAVSRELGFRFANGTAGLLIRNCAAEFGKDGIRFEGEVSALTLLGNYFETMTGIGISFSDAGPFNNVTVDGNWFLGVALGIYGRNMKSGRIGAGNHFRTCTANIDLNDDLNSLITVELPPAPLGSANALPALPAGYIIGAQCPVVFKQDVLDGGGLATVSQNWAGPAKTVELPYSGKSGFFPGGIPYCTYVVAAPTVTITTAIECDRYFMAAMLVSVNDNLGSYVFRGQIWGSGGGVSPFLTPVVTLEGTSHGARTAAVASVGGKLVITLNGFAAPISTPEGIVRLL